MKSRRESIGIEIERRSATEISEGGMYKYRYLV